MKTDPAIKPTRDARHRISSSMGDDPVKLVAYYIEMQKRFRTRLRGAPSSEGDGDRGVAKHGVPADAPKVARS